MARRKKAETMAPETAQEAHDAQGMSQDTQEQETAPGSAQEIPVGLGETIGPESEEELVGCQDEAELEKTEFIEYAVTAAGGLRLREEPDLKSPIVAVLPCGVGVLGSDRPAEGGWRQVFTGKLFGWVMDKFLEPLELSDDTE